jgi:thiamine-phosphate pyrophosphorylase
MKCAKESLLLYAVTDRSWLGQQTLVQQVEQALQGGVTFLQLREKAMDRADFLTEAKSIKALTDAYQVPFVINDNVEIAIACQADGVHVGQGDMAVKQVRSQLGPEKMIGVSVSTVEEAIRAQQEGADYLGVGAMFATATKLDADTVSFATLKAICQAVTIPVVAIGGIDAQNIGQLTGTGIAGVAVVSAIFAQADIVTATRELLDLSARL